jgi:hypothetical protein
VQVADRYHLAARRNGDLEQVDNLGTRHDAMMPQGQVGVDGT